MAPEPNPLCQQFEDELRALCERYILETGAHAVTTSMMDALQWLWPMVMLEYLALNRVAKTHPEEFRAEIRGLSEKIIGHLFGPNPPAVQ